jgi:UDP-N-acetyl-2-amino-2-deoxyglucuronate dehydrogenase
MKNLKWKKLTNKKFRIAIVGCGRISANHFQAIKLHSTNLELIAVCDNDPNILAIHTNKYNVPGYRYIEELLKVESVDLVALCTPSGLHADQTVKASTFGVNIITEKPMATRWIDGKRMVKACDEAGVHLFVVKQNRFNPTIQLLKRAIEEGRFGKIHLVQINVFWNRLQSYYDQAKWRGTWEFDGGALMNQASHYVDLLDWLIGPVEKVQAMTSTHRNIEVEDTGVLNIRWRNGVLGSLSVTMLTYSQNFEGSITIIGEKGTVRIGGVALNEINYWNLADSQDYDAYIKDTSYKTTSVYGFGHTIYYKNIINTLNGLSKPEADGREGLKSLEILIAAYLSVRNDKTISLPLEI